MRGLSPLIWSCAPSCGVIEPAPFARDTLHLQMHYITVGTPLAGYVKGPRTPFSQVSGAMGGPDRLAAGSLSPMLRARTAPLSQARRLRSLGSSSLVNDPHGSSRHAASWPQQSPEGSTRMR